MPRCPRHNPSCPISAKGSRVTVLQNLTGQFDGQRVCSLLFAGFASAMTLEMTLDAKALRVGLVRESLTQTNVASKGDRSVEWTRPLLWMLPGHFEDYAGVARRRAELPAAAATRRHIRSAACESVSSCSRASERHVPKVRAWPIAASTRWRARPRPRLPLLSVSRAAVR